MTDDRLTALQLLYSDGDAYNVDGTGQAAYAVGRASDGPALVRDGNGGIRGDRSGAPVASRLSSESLPGLVPIQSLRTHQESPVLGYGMNLRREPRVIEVTAGGVTHTLTFDLNCGGMVTSWDRAGTELLNSRNPMRGLQCQLDWTDFTVGEAVQHAAVQGGDRFSSDAGNVRGGHVLSFAESLPASGGRRVSVTLIPIEQDPRGEFSIPGVRADHGGTQRVGVWWRDMRMVVVYDICYLGKPDVHRVTVTVQTPFSVRSTQFDMALYVRAFCDVTALDNLVLWDGSTRTGISSGTSGVTGYQADLRGYMLDSARLVGDDESGTTSVKAAQGIVSAAAGTGNGDAAFGIGNVQDADAKTGARVLGDTPNGNAWRWMQRHGGTGTQNFIALAYGQFLSNRIHGGAERSWPADTAISTNAYLFTGTHATNEAAFARRNKA